MTWTAGQRYFAEFLGTFGLLLFGGGAAVFSIQASLSFLAGLDNSRVVLVSAAIGLAVLGGAYALGDISGGHFNPAVTISMAVSRRMPWSDVAPYIIAQIVGGIVGIAVVAGIAHGSATVWPIAQNAGFGSQCYAGNGSGCGFSLGAVFLLELALTFGFVLFIQRVTRPDASAKNLAPIAIGLTLMITNLVAIPIDGASINPARSFGPAIISWVTGGPTWPLQQVWLFFLAPILGGILAALVEMGLRAAPTPP
jgi:aquaporin Z